MLLVDSIPLLLDESSELTRSQVHAFAHSGTVSSCHRHLLALDIVLF
jgi:hypothetical protein